MNTVKCAAYRFRYQAADMPAIYTVRNIRVRAPCDAAPRSCVSQLPRV